MLTVIGTLPYPDIPVIEGEARYSRGIVTIAGRWSFQAQRGTAALLGAACEALKYLGLDPPRTVLAGDTGQGDGSRRLYCYLVENPKIMETKVLVFHYLFPDVDWHGKIIMAIDKISPKPILIADAGFMYVAKMSGQANFYDLFTPDLGELAFLADEEAPHPFYTRGFLLHEDNRPFDLITRAYLHGNSAKNLLVKAAVDHIVVQGHVIATESEPNVSELEAIGGTGDTLTGIVSALVASRFELPRAMILAAKANRIAGSLAKPTVATPITSLIDKISEALGEVLEGSARSYSPSST